MTDVADGGCRFSAVGIPPLEFISPGFSAMFNSEWSGEFWWGSSSERQPYSRRFLKRFLFTGGEFISRGLAFYPLGFGKWPGRAHEGMAAVSKPLPQINKENKIKQTGFMKWKCLICVFLSSTSSPPQIKATCRLGTISSLKSSCSVWPRQSFVQKIQKIY